MTRPRLNLVQRRDPPVLLCAAADCGEHGSWGGEMGAFCVHHAPLAYFPSGCRPLRMPHGPSTWPGDGTPAARELCKRWRARDGP